MNFIKITSDVNPLLPILEEEEADKTDVEPSHESILNRINSIFSDCWKLIDAAEGKVENDDLMKDVWAIAIGSSLGGRAKREEYSDVEMARALWVSEDELRELKDSVYEKMRKALEAQKSEYIEDPTLTQAATDLEPALKLSRSELNDINARYNRARRKAAYLDPFWLMSKKIARQKIHVPRGSDTKSLPQNIARIIINASKVQEKDGNSIYQLAYMETKGNKVYTAIIGKYAEYIKLPWQITRRNRTANIVINASLLVGKKLDEMFDDIIKSKEPEVDVSEISSRDKINNILTNIDMLLARYNSEICDSFIGTKDNPGSINSPQALRAELIKDDNAAATEFSELFPKMDLESVQSMEQEIKSEISTLGSELVEKQNRVQELTDIYIKLKDPIEVLTRLIVKRFIKQASDKDFVFRTDYGYPIGKMSIGSKEYEVYVFIRKGIDEISIEFGGEVQTVEEAITRINIVEAKEPQTQIVTYGRHKVHIDKIKRAIDKYIDSHADELEKKEHTAGGYVAKPGTISAVLHELREEIKDVGSGEIDDSLARKLINAYEYCMNVSGLGMTSSNPKHVRIIRICTNAMIDLASQYPQFIKITDPDDIYLLDFRDVSRKLSALKRKIEAYSEKDVDKETKEKTLGEMKYNYDLLLYRFYRGVISKIGTTRLPQEKTEKKKEKEQKGVSLNVNIPFSMFTEEEMLDSDLELPVTMVSAVETKDKKHSLVTLAFGGNILATNLETGDPWFAGRQARKERFYPSVGDTILVDGVGQEFDGEFIVHNVIYPKEPVLGRSTDLLQAGIQYLSKSLVTKGQTRVNGTVKVEAKDTLSIGSMVIDGDKLMTGMSDELRWQSWIGSELDIGRLVYKQLISAIVENYKNYKMQTEERKKRITYRVNISGEDYKLIFVGDSLKFRVTVEGKDVGKEIALLKDKLETAPDDEKGQISAEIDSLKGKRIIRVYITGDMRIPEFINNIKGVVTETGMKVEGRVTRSINASVFESSDLNGEDIDIGTQIYFNTGDSTTIQDFDPKEPAKVWIEPIQGFIPDEGNTFVIHKNIGAMPTTIKSRRREAGYAGELRKSRSKRLEFGAPDTIAGEVPQNIFDEYVRWFQESHKRYIKDKRESVQKKTIRLEPIVDDFWAYRRRIMEASKFRFNRYMKSKIRGITDDVINKVYVTLASFYDPAIVSFNDRWKDRSSWYLAVKDKIEEKISTIPEFGPKIISIIEETAEAEPSKVSEYTLERFIEMLANAAHELDEGTKIEDEIVRLQKLWRGNHIAFWNNTFTLFIQAFKGNTYRAEHYLIEWIHHNMPEHEEEAARAIGIARDTKYEPYKTHEEIAAEAGKLGITRTSNVEHMEDPSYVSDELDKMGVKNKDSIMQKVYPLWDGYEEAGEWKGKWKEGGKERLKHILHDIVYTESKSPEYMVKIISENVRLVPILEQLEYYVRKNDIESIKKLYNTTLVHLRKVDEMINS